MNFVIAYDESNKKEIGQYYNKIMHESNGYVCFLDSDAMFLSYDFAHHIKRVISETKKLAYTCMCNRVGNKNQVYNIQGDDIQVHRKYAEKIRSNTIEPFPKGSHLSGFMLIIHKSLWEKAGGFKTEGILGVDVDFHRRIRQLGEEIYIMKGVYMYHWYRGGEQTIAHLL